METIFHSGTRVFYIAAGGRGVLFRVLNVYSLMYLVVYSFMYLVVYLVVDSLVNLVVYYSVYLVVYLVYLVVHSSKQLSPLIKACNPISPFSFFPRVVLTSRRRGFFRTTVLGVRICSSGTIIVLENYICGCARLIRQFPREGEAHTHHTSA